MVYAHPGWQLVKKLNMSTGISICYLIHFVVGRCIYLDFMHHLKPFLFLIHWNFNNFCSFNFFYFLILTQLSPTTGTFLLPPFNHESSLSNTLNPADEDRCGSSGSFFRFKPHGMPDSLPDFSSSEDKVVVHFLITIDHLLHTFNTGHSCIL